MSILQLSFYLLPLVTIPVVTRAFGPDLFGFIVTATAAAAYVGLFINFGFGWSGPRLVARQQGQAEDSSADVSAILAAQLLIAILASIPYLAWTLIGGEPGELRIVQWAILATAVLNALVPSWLFLGLERMRELVIPQLATRVVATAAILMLVRSRADLLLYALINTAASAVGLVMFLWLIQRIGIVLSRPRVDRVRVRLRESSALFASNVAISFYTTANVLIVSYLLGNGAAGIFGLADRVRQAAAGATVPMTQAVYPFVCRTAGTRDPSERLARRRLFLMMIVAASGVGVVMYAAASVGVALLGGAAFHEATTLVRIFALVPLLVVCSNILGVQVMLPMGLDKQVAAVLALGAVFGVAAQFLLTLSFGLAGSAVSYVITELIVCAALAIAIAVRGGFRMPAGSQ